MGKVTGFSCKGVRIEFVPTKDSTGFVSRSAYIQALTREDQACY